ncbi:hypothetical protein FSP39_015122 [Pinctada imbricata]|uniref:STAS domain-containing protein n=1 Tax=Pinctada imbricata TaxID=66713 RepID=A0AA88YJM9_PINIB|nr:hypothetical protein FSP39_015122 [Pinctada imbricata]
MTDNKGYVPDGEPDRPTPGQRVQGRGPVEKKPKEKVKKETKTDKKGTKESGKDVGREKDPKENIGKQLRKMCKIRTEFEIIPKTSSNGDVVSKDADSKIGNGTIHENGLDGTFAVASLMVGSAIEKGMKSTSLVVSTCSNVTTMVPSNMTNDSIAKYTHECVSNEADVQLQFAMAVSMMAGFIMLGMGLLRLGFVTTYLSDPLISGFTTGAACHVFTSQITHIFGISVTRYSGAFKLIFTYRDFFEAIPNTNAITLITSVLCIAFVYCIKEFINNNPKIKPKLKMPVPVELIAVVLGTVISFAIDLDGTYDVKNVGDIPKGLPIPSVPNFSLLPTVISDAFAIAIVVFAVSVSMGKILARKHEYEIDSNQELIAFAMTGIVGSFFSSYLASASLSRSLIQEQVGGVTQLTGLVSCALLLLVLLVLAPYFKTLPKCVLAAIIIVALKGMFRQLLELPRLWRLSKIDFFVWVSTFLATVILDVDLGLLVGVVIAILSIVFRVQRPYVCLLGQMPGTDIYRDVSVYKEAEPAPGIRIFRFENALFFVSVEHFKTKLYEMTCNPRHLKNEIRQAKKKINKEKQDWETRKISFSRGSTGSQTHEVEINLDNTSHKSFNTSIALPNAGFHTIILDCSTWSFIDSMGVKALSTVVTEYRDVDVNIYLALCKGGVREMFEKTGFFDLLDRENMFVSIHDAVLQAQNKRAIQGDRSVSVQDGGSNLSSRRASDASVGNRIADGAPQVEGDVLINTLYPPKHSSTTHENASHSMFGLQIPYSDNNAVKTLVRRAAILPLIPLDAIDDVWFEALEDRDDADITDYVTEQWVESDSLVWKHFGNQRPRTTNNLEGWHSKLKRIVQHAHPIIYTTIQTFKDLERQ